MIDEIIPSTTRSQTHPRWNWREYLVNLSPPWRVGGLEMYAVMIGRGCCYSG
jgi:hypothetical protein